MNAEQLLEPCDQLCEFPDCTALAEGWVEAQWTLADFVRYEACFNHMAEMTAALSDMRIEGEYAAVYSAAYA